MTCSTGLTRPTFAQLIPSRFLYKWKYNHDGVAFRHKTRVVVQGFHEVDIGADKAAPVATLEPVHLLIANAAQNGLNSQTSRHQDGILARKGSPDGGGSVRGTSKGVRVY